MPKPVVFGAYDPHAELTKSVHNLPHWFQSGVAVFITFRTIDSMPQSVVDRWIAEQVQWLRRQGLDERLAWSFDRLSELPLPQQRQFRRFRSQKWHSSLDQCHGACVLRRPELAEIVGRALQFFDGQRYDLDSVIVMPNHVHLLVQFRPPTTLSKQSESWLRYTATQINRRLGQTGHFWQSEPFDHLVRSADQFEYLQRYIAENPIKAKLPVGQFLYWSRGENL